MPAPNPSFEQRLIAAANYASSGFQDMTAKASPLFAMLKKKGRYRSYTGPQIEEKLIYGRPEGMWYSDYDIFPTKPVDMLTKALFTPKQMVVPITISGRDMVDNMGETQEIDLMRTLIDGAKSTAREMVYTAMYGDGTADGGKQMTGLRAMIPDNPAAGTYGGINRANWTWWRPGSYDVSNGDLPGYTALTPDSVLPILRTVLAKHTTGTGGPDLIVASPEWAAAVHARLDSIQRVTTQGDTAELGFNTIRLNIGGKTLEFFEETGIGSQMPANTVFLLNTDTVTLRYHAARNWKVDEERRPLNQDALVIPILWQGEMIMNNPRENAKITI